MKSSPKKSNNNFICLKIIDIGATETVQFRKRNISAKKSNIIPFVNVSY